MVLRWMKRYLKFIIAALCLLVILLLELASRAYVKDLDTQNLAKRWSGDSKAKFTQVSVFFPQGAGLTEDSYKYLEHELGNSLTAAETDDAPAGRQMVVSCSTEGTLSLASDKGSADDVRCYAVSKDFFLFHPLTLLYGQYFNSADETEDGIIIDDNVAWKLFGAVDVVGLTVSIGDTAYVIRGVVQADDGHYTKEANDGDLTVYVDYALYEHALGYDGDFVDDALTYDTVELLMYNPVTDFGKSAMESALTTVVGEDGNYELVENSKRFSLGQRFYRIRHFGTRSMRSNGIIYPYWENRARGYEDVSSAYLLVELLFAIYPIGLGIWLLVLAWVKRDTWKKAVGNWCKQSVFPAIKKLYKDACKAIQTKKNMVD